MSVCNCVSGRWSLSGLLLLTICLGCGTGSYQDRLDARVGTLGSESSFSKLGDEVVVFGTPLVLSLPDSMTLVDKSADPKRLTPSFMQIVNRKATYETSIPDVDQGKQHYYCYLATTDQKSGDPLVPYHTRISSVFSDTIEPTKETFVKNAVGTSFAWKKFRATGEQEFFFIDAQGKEQFITMPGTLEIWTRLIDEANTYLVIAWWVPTSLVGPEYADLDKNAKLVAGSVRLN